MTTDFSGNMSSETPPATGSAPSAPVTFPEADPEPIYDLLLDLRRQFTPLNLTPLEEILLRVWDAFPDDGGLITCPLRGKGTGQYHVLTQPIKALVTFEVNNAELSVQFIARDQTPAGTSRKGTFV